MGKAFPFPSSEDATEATTTEARGCKVESSSSSLQAAAASPTQGRHCILLTGKTAVHSGSKWHAGDEFITSVPLLPTHSILQNLVWSYFWWRPSPTLLCFHNITSKFLQQSQMSLLQIILSIVRPMEYIIKNEKKTWYLSFYLPAESWPALVISHSIG